MKTHTRALEIIATLNEKTTTVETARQIASDALRNTAALPPCDMSLNGICAMKKVSDYVTQLMSDCKRLDHDKPA